MATTHTISPDEFKKVPTVDLLMLDPTKPYVVQVSPEAPADFISALTKNLSVAGVFAIVITTQVKFFSSFPIDIVITKRKMEVQMDSETKPARKRAPAKSKKTTKKKVVDEA